MLTQKELSTLLGITTIYFSGVKNGRYNASVKLAKRLAKRTGTDPALWIFGNARDRREAVTKITGGSK